MGRLLDLVRASDAESRAQLFIEKMLDDGVELRLLANGNIRMKAPREIFDRWVHVVVECKPVIVRLFNLRYRKILENHEGTLH